jgi:TrmH family RNA methyltransferase
MGNVFRLPVIEVPDLKTPLSLLRSEYAHTLFATVLDENAEPLHRVEPPVRSAIVFGSEGEGLESDLIEFCDRRITIPMQGGTDSLNVAVAAGIFLYHFDPHRAVD